MIATDNAKIAKNLNIQFVKELSNSFKLDELSAIICSRAFAAKLLNLDTPNLRLIQLTSAGYEGVDVELAKSKSIQICNAADVYNVGMAEFVVHAILMRAKRYNHSIKNRGLRPFRNYQYITELMGKTVGILGTGNIGSQIAKRLEAFDMQVLGYDLQNSDRPYFKKVYSQETLKEFLGECDYIVNCIPLFRSTEGMLCKAWFDLMKDNVTIVNVGRQKIFNERDFIKFLKSHKDATAILDMFEKFPNPITNPYRRLSNVLVLPGVTAISQEIDIKLQKLCKRNIDALNSNKELINTLWK